MAQPALRAHRRRLPLTSSNTTLEAVVPASSPPASSLWSGGGRRGSRGRRCPIAEVVNRLPLSVVA